MTEMLAADTDCDNVASVNAGPKPAGWKKLTFFQKPSPPEQLASAGQNTQAAKETDFQNHGMQSPTRGGATEL